MKSHYQETFSLQTTPKSSYERYTSFSPPNRTLKSFNQNVSSVQFEPPKAGKKKFYCCNSSLTTIKRSDLGIMQTDSSNRKHIGKNRYLLNKSANEDSPPKTRISAPRKNVDSFFNLERSNLSTENSPSGGRKHFHGKALNPILNGGGKNYYANPKRVEIELQCPSPKYKLMMDRKSGILRSDKRVLKEKVDITKEENKTRMQYFGRCAPPSERRAGPTESKEVKNLLAYDYALKYRTDAVASKVSEIPFNSRIYAKNPNSQKPPLANTSYSSVRRTNHIF